jgi:hypothetical protein
MESDRHLQRSKRKVAKAKTDAGFSTSRLLQNHPEHLMTVTIAGGTHTYRVVDNPCEQIIDQPFSDELDVVLNNWLTEIGY